MKKLIIIIFTILMVFTLGCNSGGGGGGDPDPAVKADPSPEPEPEPIDPIMWQTQALIGTWYMGYTIITYWDDWYWLDYIGEEKNDQGARYVWGYDEHGDDVLACYWPSDGNWALLDDSNLFAKFYTFQIIGNEAHGCYYQMDRDTGELSMCFPMDGIRTSTSTALFAPVEKSVQGEVDRLFEADWAEDLNDFEHAEKFRKMLDMLNR